MKKLGLITAIFIVSIASFKNIYAQPPTVYVKNIKLEADSVQFQKTTTFIPIGVITRMLGATVTWNKPSVIIQSDNDKLQIDVGDLNGHKNGELIFLRRTPFLHSGRVFVPLRVITEQLGYCVTYDEHTKSVFITTDKKKQCTHQTKELKFEPSPDQLWSTANEVIYPTESEVIFTPYGGAYKILYLKNNQTKRVEELYATSAFYKGVKWTKQNKLIFSGINDITGKKTKNTVIIYDPNTKQVIDSFHADCYHYQKEKNCIYYFRYKKGDDKDSIGSDCWIYDIQTHQHTKTTKQEYTKYTY